MRTVVLESHGTRYEAFACLDPDGEHMIVGETSVAKWSLRTSREAADGPHYLESKVPASLSVVDAANVAEAVRRAIRAENGRAPRPPTAACPTCSAVYATEDASGIRFCRRCGAPVDARGRS